MTVLGRRETQGERHLDRPSPVKWCNSSRGVLRTTIVHQLAMSSGTTSSVGRGPSI